jgi:hypothetical protein
MKIEVFEIASKEDKVYQELLEQYKSNPEVQALLRESIISSEMILAGDFRLITMLNYAIDTDDIKVYLVKDIDDDIFLWVIGKFMNNGEITMYPLLKKQSKYLQLEIRKVLIERGLIRDFNEKIISKNTHYSLDSIFPLTFDIITTLDDRAVQKVLWEIDSREIAKALKGENETVREKIFKNMSKGAAQMLKEDMEFMGPVRIKDVKESQEKILNVIRRFEQTGEIVISYSRGESIG